MPEKLMSLSEDGTQFKVKGWADSKKPEVIDYLSYVNRVTKRFVQPMGIRFFIRDSAKEKQGEVIYNFNFEFDPQDPVSCARNSPVGNLG